MSNIAHELLELFDSWDVPQGESVAKQRFAVTPTENHIDAWRRATLAVNLVDEIAVMLRGLEDLGQSVLPFLRRVPDWYQAAVEPRLNWYEGIPGGQPGLDEAPKEALQMLALYLDHAGLPDPAEVVELHSLQTAVEDLRKLVVDEPDLALSARAYLLGLIDRLRWVLDHPGDIGAEHLRRLTNELSGATHAVADSGVLSPDRVPTWRRAAKAIVVAVIFPAMVGLSDAASQHMLDANDAPSVTVVRVEQPAAPDQAGPEGQPPS